MLVDGVTAIAEVDVVIGGIQGNQADDEAAHELNPGLAVEAEEMQAPFHQVWRNCSPLAGQASRFIRDPSRVQLAHSRQKSMQLKIVRLYDRR